jgi:cell cycle sensor histidine kinase DivJ
VTHADPSHSPAASAPEELRDILSWHGAWLLAAFAGFIAMLAIGRTGMAPIALLVGGLPGALGQLLQRWDGRAVRTALLAAWSICGALACVMTGGVTGPLAVWCLAPFAAAVMFGGTALAAEGAALALCAVAAAALIQFIGQAPAPPPAPAAFWLGLIGLATIGLGLAAGLLLSTRRAEAGGAGLPAEVADAHETEAERILNEQPHLVMALDGDGRILSAYGYAPQGVPADALFGADLASLADAADRPAIHEALAQAARSGWVELAFAPAGERDRTCALSLRHGPDGRLYAIARDATAERSREAALEAARQEAENLNTGKSRFLANMSHELRTPLNAVMGFSDVMRSQLFGELSPRYLEYAQLIHESGQHLLDLINDVLDMSKIEAERYQLQLEAFDARDAVAGALRLTRVQADAAGVSLRGVTPAHPLEVEADKRAVKQIVLNLVSNALKFTPRGGSVTVTADGHGDSFELVVTDTGIGIAEDDLTRLGQPYEQAGDFSQRARGTGLGLSLVRAFAELHGGEMTIESRLGEGTSVTVRMPVLRPAPVGDPAGPPGARIIAFNAQR